MPLPEVPWPLEPPDDDEHVVGEYQPEPPTELAVRPTAPVKRRSSTEVQETDDDESNGWAEPEPLLSYADPLPLDALGGVLGPMVRAVAHTYQVPSDVAVTMALPLVTTAAAGRWKVQVKNGWSEILALATMSILGSSGGKSPVLRELSAPLTEHEKNARVDAIPECAKSKAQHEMLKDRADKLRSDLKNYNDTKLLAGSEQHADYLEKQQRYVDLCEELELHKVTVAPRWTLDDVTPEKLAGVMDEQDGAVGIVSAEPGIFGTLGGRYSQGVANLDVVLKGVSGDRIQIDRKSNESGPVIIDHPVLSITLGVQPGMMRRLGERVEFRESGMLGRFLPVMPPSKMGHRLLDTDGVPEDISQRWWDNVKALATEAQKLRSRGVRKTIVLKPDAEHAVREFRERLEPEFREGGRLEHLTDFGGKLAGAAVRIAGALTLLEDPEADSVQADVMADALRLADAYIDHAHTAFGTLTGGDPSTPGGRVIAWLVHNGEPWVVQRDIQRAFQHKPWSRTAKDIAAVLEALEAKGWVRKSKGAVGSKGGRPAVGWEINPRAFEVSSRRAQGPSLDPDVEDGAA